MFQIHELKVDNVFYINQLEINQSVICIVGQSGSGKSTLLRLLNNLDSPTEGSIYFKNQSIMDIDPLTLRKKIVMVPQTNIIFEGTIRENLLIGLYFSRDVSVSDETLTDMMNQLNVDKDLNTHASDLSGGEKQRLSLGRVLLMQQAEVFLLDEPTSDLDDQTTEEVLRQFISNAKKNNQQIIMVTHDQYVADTFADVIINMDKYHMLGDHP